MPLKTHRDTAKHKRRRFGDNNHKGHRQLAGELENGRANRHHRLVVDHTRRRSFAAHRVPSQEAQDMAKV